MSDLNGTTTVIDLTFIGVFGLSVSTTLYMPSYSTSSNRGPDVVEASLDFIVVTLR